MAELQLLFLRFSLREIMTTKKCPRVFSLFCSKDCCIICGKFFDGGFFGFCSFASSVGELPSSSVVYGEVKWTEEITGRIGASNWCS